MASVPRLDNQGFDFEVDDGSVTAEHVHIEGDGSDAIDPKRARPVGEPFMIRDGLRNCMAALAFLEGHHLGVRSRRGRSVRRYTLDLRFVDPAPLVARHVAWRCLYGALASAAVGAIAVMLPGAVDVPAIRAASLPVAIIAATGTACLLALGWHRTREVLRFVSLHGRAPLLEITAGLDCRRRSQVFLAELERQVEQARRSWGQPRTHHLRDEMREHHRLHAEGVLEPAQYEAAKGRILGAHG